MNDLIRYSDEYIKKATKAARVQILKKDASYIKRGIENTSFDNFSYGILPQIETAEASRIIPQNNFRAYAHIEGWNSIDTIWGEIIEITEYKVIIKCLLNEKDKSFQVRKFDKEPFLGAVKMEINQFVEIKISTRPGERRFTYQNATRGDLEEIFEPQNYLEGLEGSPFFQPLSSNNENNF